MSELSNFSYLFIFRIFDKGMSFVGLYFLTKYLSVEHYGFYVLSLSLIGLCSIFSLPGMSYIIASNVARGNHNIIYAASISCFKHSLWGAFVLIIAGFTYKTISDPESFEPILLTGLLFPFYYGLTGWRSVLSGEEKFKALAIRDTFINSFSILSIVICAQFYKLSVFLVVLLSIGLPSVLNVLFTLKSIITFKQHDAEDIGVGKSISLYSSVGLLAMHVDKIIIPIFLSTEHLAYYYFAEKISEFFKGVIQDLGGVIFPSLAREKSYSDKIEEKLLILSIALGGTILFFGWFILPLIINKFFSESYSKSTLICQVLLTSVGFATLQGLRFRYILAKKDITNIKSVNLRTCAVRIVCSAVCIPVLGLWGAVLSTCIYRIYTGYLVNKIVKAERLKE